ncbi:MAG: hypothetical protein ACRDSN_16240, partial [Pseudonocardiaceae bacterium]
MWVAKIAELREDSTLDTDRHWLDNLVVPTLASCGSPSATGEAEHACLRCAQLHVNPKMLPRLDELESDLTDRRNRAAAEAWRGEIEGLDRTLQC